MDSEDKRQTWNKITKKSKNHKNKFGGIKKDYYLCSPKKRGEGKAGKAEFIEKM